MPNEEEVGRFKDLYKKRVGKELGDAEALEAATRLLHLWVLINFELFKDHYEEG